MGKTGNIEQFGLLELLQLVDLCRATGGLLIKSPSGIGTINFHLGEIVYVGVEGAKLRLGERMVEEGVISLEQLRAMLLLQQRTKPWKPIGSLCLENKLVTDQQLQQVVHRQMITLIQELLTWQQGMYRFEQGEVTVSDPISLSLFDFVMHAGQHYKNTLAPKIIEEPFEVGQMQQILPQMENRLTEWRGDFFRAEEQPLYNRLMRYKTLTTMMKGNSYQVSRALVMSEVQALLEKFPNEGFFCWQNTYGTYNRISFSETDVVKKGIKLSTDLFDLAQAGNFQIVPDLGGDLLTLPVAGQPLFAVGISASPQSVTHGAYTMETQALRQLGVALNMAFFG